MVFVCHEKQFPRGVPAFGFLGRPFFWARADWVPIPSAVVLKHHEPHAKIKSNNGDRDMF